MSTITDALAEDADEMAYREQAEAAFEYHGEAWAEGISDGIEPEILADTAIVNALAETVRARGEAYAVDILDKMRARMDAGDFSLDRNLH